MKPDKSSFDLLGSDDVLAEGMLASDVGSLWRRLGRLPPVQEVARALGSDPEEIRALCDFADELLNEPYDSRYRHPNDIAICASLVILGQSPLARVRNLLARLRRVDEPSLIWIRRMAEYCDDHWTNTTFTRVGTPPDKEDVTPDVREISKAISGTEIGRYDLAA